MPFDWVNAAKENAVDADEVRAAADIVAVISSRMKLRRKGREFVGICPFHEDRSPSMAVITHKGRGFYKCHACGAGGDAVRFVMEFDGVDYPEALRRISDGFTAGFAGVKRTATAPKIEEHRYREDCGEVIAAWREKTTIDHAIAAAKILGVSARALSVLGFAWCPEGSGSYAFPMRDETGAVCGIRLREPVDSGAAKWALKGSRAGVFMLPTTERRRLSRVYIVEGPTDAAAAIDMLGILDEDADCAVIGRASCTGQHHLVVSAIRLIARPEPEVVVIADADGPGVEGARALADDLVAEFARVKVCVPQQCTVEGFKDIRAMYRGLSIELCRSMVGIKVNACGFHRRRSVK